VAEQGAFGMRMAKVLDLDSAPSITVKTLHKAQLAVTRLRCETGLFEKTKPIASEKAFLVSLQLREIPFHQLWLRGKPVPVGHYPERAVSVVDLEQDPRAYLPDPFDCLQFYVTRAALDEVASENGARRIETLRWSYGAIDPVTSQLSMTILPALERPHETSRLFIDHAVYALNAHFAHAYGGMRPASVNIRGGLAPWQERRCKEIMRECEDEQISLAHLAGECRLSRSHFARAFKKTTGQSPHRWLLEHRLGTAKHMLINTQSSISDVAFAAGFADQSHLTRVFSKMVGAPPGAWRRAMRNS
jgi:AraC family transcriptional regulator